MCESDDADPGDVVSYCELRPSVLVANLTAGIRLYDTMDYSRDTRQAFERDRPSRMDINVVVRAATALPARYVYRCVCAPCELFRVFRVVIKVNLCFALCLGDVAGRWLAAGDVPLDEDRCFSFTCSTAHHNNGITLE